MVLIRLSFLEPKPYTLLKPKAQITQITRSPKLSLLKAGEARSSGALNSGSQGDPERGSQGGSGFKSEEGEKSGTGWSSDMIAFWFGAGFFEFVSVGGILSQLQESGANSTLLISPSRGSGPPPYTSS